VSIRNKSAAGKPLAGVRITGSLHMTIQTAVLIETLTSLARMCAGELQHLFDAGPCCRCDRSYGRAVFAWKGESLEDYWWCTYQALAHKGGLGRNWWWMTRRCDAADSQGV